MPTSTPASYRDLNKNGKLDPYEDSGLPIEERIDDLLSQMTLEEKAGQMFYPVTFVNPPFPLSEEQQPQSIIQQRLMTHITVFGGSDRREIAEWTNQLQRWAEDTRLGIPLSMGTDPRHAVTTEVGDMMHTRGLSQWPDPVGMAATGELALVQQYADIARQELRALGFNVYFGPQADLATEPRWGRISGTFGEDAGLAAEMTAAFIRGMQGPQFGADSVACLVKHFPGGGPQRDGEDPHFPYGREQVYPAGMFDYHLKPFEAAFAAGASQIMPYYGMPVGTEFEEVGFSFNRQVITELLREHYGFDGVVCADWGVLTDSFIMGKRLPARAWGVEHLSIPDRAAKALDAGVDMFGGEACPEVIVALVESGRIDEDRIDLSVRRLLREKFRLGLFDNPYVDVDAVERRVGIPTFIAAGFEAQRRSIVLLKNDNTLLPLAEDTRIWVDGIDPEIAPAHATVTEDLENADCAIVRLPSPFEHRDQYPLESLFHSGSLAFDPATIARIEEIAARKPLIVDVYLERPAVLPEIAAAATVLLGSFGACDSALLDIIFGKSIPTARLPFELPSSLAAVEAQSPDAPHDTANPLYPRGFRLEPA